MPEQGGPRPASENGYHSSRHRRTLADEATHGISRYDKQADYGKERPDCVAANYVEATWGPCRDAMHSEWRLVPTVPPRPKDTETISGHHSVDHAWASITTRAGKAW